MRFTLPTLLVTVAALIASSACLGQAPNTPPAAAPPRPSSRPATNPLPPGPIKAEPMLINFGYVKPEEEVHGSFTLFNSLDRPVKIDQATPSCQCTGLDAEGKEIPAKGTLDVHFSMKMSKAPVHKIANVTLVMRSINQAIRVEFEAEVAYAVRATPNFVDAQKGRLSGTFELAATDGKPFRVLAIQDRPPVFVGFDPAKDPAQTKYTLRYDFSTPNLVVPKYLLVETDREDCPLIDLRVRHETTSIKPKCKPAEFRSSIGRVKPGATGQFDLELEDMGTTKVTSVRSLWDGAAVTLTDQKADGKSVLATCVVTPKAGQTGLLYFPVQFQLSNGVTYDHIVVGVVR